MLNVGLKVLVVDDFPAMRRIVKTADWVLNVASAAPVKLPSFAAL